MISSPHIRLSPEVTTEASQAHQPGATKNVNVRGSQNPASPPGPRHALGSNNTTRHLMSAYLDTTLSADVQNYIRQAATLQQGLPEELKTSINTALRNRLRKKPSDSLLAQTLTLDDKAHFEVLINAGAIPTPDMMENAIAGSHTEQIERLKQANEKIARKIDGTNVHSPHVPAETVAIITEYLNNPDIQSKSVKRISKALTKQVNAALQAKLQNNIDPPQSLINSALTTMPLAQVRVLLKASSNPFGDLKNQTIQPLQKVMLRYVNAMPANATLSRSVLYNPDDAPAIMALLINKYGIDVNQPSSKNIYPLAYAAGTGSAAAFKVLLDNKADVNYRGPFQTTLMHDLSILGTADMFALIEHNDDVMKLMAIPDSVGNPPIFCTVGHVDRGGGQTTNQAAFDFLRTHGASVDAPSGTRIEYGKQIPGETMMDAVFRYGLNARQNKMLADVDAATSDPMKNGEHRLAALQNHKLAKDPEFIRLVLEPRMKADTE